MPLEPEQIEAIRTRYIRDLYVPPVPNVSAAIAKSHYNAANRKNFISDDELQAKAEDVGRAYREELSGVFEDEYNRLVSGGMLKDDADAEATALQNDAFYRLIRASVFEDMMLDPGYTGSISDNDQRTAMFKAWKEQIIRDRQFTRQRTSAPFRSLPLERR